MSIRGPQRYPITLKAAALTFLKQWFEKAVEFLNGTVYLAMEQKRTATTCNS